MLLLDTAVWDTGARLLLLFVMSSEKSARTESRSLRRAAQCSCILLSSRAWLLLILLLGDAGVMDPFAVTMLTEADDGTESWEE